MRYPFTCVWLRNTTEGVTQPLFAPKTVAGEVQDGRDEIYISPLASDYTPVWEVWTLALPPRLCKLNCAYPCECLNFNEHARLQA